MSPLMYGPEGQKEWVWPWQVDERRSEGWTSEPTEQPMPLRLPREVGYANPYYSNPLVEAAKILREVDEPRRLAGLGFSGEDTQVQLGTPHWIGTDELGRPVYE